MSNVDKVVWTEGMFLRPHHFQRAESHLKHQIRQRLTTQSPYQWGFESLQIDDKMVKQGIVSLVKASGVMPDGTYFEFDSQQQGPIPLKIDEEMIGQKVVLAIPRQRGGREEVIFKEEKDSLARYIAFEQDVADDNQIAVGNATVQFAHLRLTLMLEQDVTAEWAAMGLCIIREGKNGNALNVDDHFLPPVLNLFTFPQFQTLLRDFQGLLAQQSKQLSKRLSQSGRFNTSEMIEFSLLTLINRHLGLMAHLQQRPLMHPEELWMSWLPLAAELMTWSPQRTVTEKLPEYDHDNLAFCFHQLMFLLRQGLSLVMEESAVQLKLIEKTHGLHIAAVNDLQMVTLYGFVIAVKANVPNELLQTHFPAQMKVAPVSKIRDLVHLQLPGLTLRAMPAAPPQIPWHAGYNYFEVEKGGELWQDMEKSGAFALHLAGEFPGLAMEFWAIRRSS